MLPTERKVQAATAGAGIGYLLSQAVLYELDAHAFTPGTIGDLPALVTTAVPIVVGMALAWVAGYKARHTARPDLPATRR